MTQKFIIHLHFGPTRIGDQTKLRPQWLRSLIEGLGAAGYTLILLPWKHEDQLVIKLAGGYNRILFVCSMRSLR